MLPSCLRYPTGNATPQCSGHMLRTPRIEAMQCKKGTSNEDPHHRCGPRAGPGRSGACPGRQADRDAIRDASGKAGRGAQSDAGRHQGRGPAGDQAGRRQGRPPSRPPTRTPRRSTRRRPLPWRRPARPRPTPARARGQATPRPPRSPPRPRSSNGPRAYPPCLGGQAPAATAAGALSSHAAARRHRLSLHALGLFQGRRTAALPAVVRQGSPRRRSESTIRT